MSNHISQCLCPAYIVTCVNPLRVVVLLCTLLYITVQSTVSLFQAQDVSKQHKSSSDVAGTTVLFKVLNCKIKNVFFIFCVCFLCIICVKSIINLLQYRTVQPNVLGTQANSVGFSNELDLQALGMELTRMQGTSCFTVVASTAYMWLWSGV